MLEPPVNAGELVAALYAPLYSNKPVATLSTYALVAASCAPVGSVTFCILALIPVVTKSYIWSPVARAVPAFATAPVTTVNAGIGPVPLAIVSCPVVALVTAVKSPPALTNAVPL